MGQGTVDKKEKEIMDLGFASPILEKAYVTRFGSRLLATISLEAYMFFDEILDRGFSSSIP